MTPDSEGPPPAGLPRHLQIIRRLGSGGMGTVYLARDTRLHRLGALKVIREDLAGDPETRELFTREARNAARLQHPGIVPVYEFSDDAALPWQLLRYLEAPSLADRLEHHGPMAPDAARWLLAELADVLEYAHREGVVHRDLKPDNIYLEGPPDRPRPVVADFGVAFRTGLDLGPGEQRRQFGTPRFMAPEQAAGDHDVDGRADIYSLGVIGYLLLTGAVPYDGSTAAVAARAATGDRVPLTDRAPNAPRELIAIIDRCLAPNPADRWQKAAGLREALRGVAGGTSGAGRATPPSRPQRGHPLRLPSRSLLMPLGADLRFAARSLRRTSTVTLAALTCLALGIGATTAIFSAVNRALLRPLPFARPAELVTVFRTTPHFSDGPFSPANVTDLIRDAQAMDLVALVNQTGFLERPEGSDRVSLMRADAGVFSLLGVTPRAGRLLAAADQDPGAPPAAVISEENWRTRFGADPAIAGQTVRLDGRLVTIVGVLPPEFQVPHGSRLLRADFWIPLVFDSAEAGRRRSNSLLMVGRLRPGRSIEQAATEMDALMRGLTELHPELTGEGIRLAPLQAESRRALQGPLLLLLAAVGFVLLIAVSNVASLMLARGAERHREVAIRSALGAARRDIVRKVLVEASVLVAVGTTLGLGLAWVGVRVIGSLAAARQPQLAGLTLDGPVLAFAAVLAAVVSLACGVVPALRSARVDPQTTLRAGDQRAGGDVGRHRFLRGLAVAEVALSVVLLLGAGLVIRGFGQLINQPTGFDEERLLTAVVTLDREKYRGEHTGTRFLDPALAAIRAQPGVRGAGALSLIPYDNWGNNFNVRYEGRPVGDPTSLPLVEGRLATDGLFAAMGIPLLEGRLLGPDDARPDAPHVVVVNRALVERDFAGRSPLGSRYHTGDTTFATIVGVVGDIRNFGPERPTQPEAYTSWGALSNPGTAFSLVIRTDGDPAALAAATRAAIRAVDPTAAVSLVRPLTDIIDRSVGRPRFYMTLLGAFAAVAVVLTVAGLYGLMSYLVAQRTREIGIRMALGSTPGRTSGLVFLQGGRLVAAGLVTGLVLAAWLTRLLSGLLFGVSPLDPAAWAAAVGLLVLTAGVALLLPARRATRVDPLRAIRTE